MQKPTLSDIPVLFEDEHIIVLDKPAGLLTIPDRWDHEVSNLLTMLKIKYTEIFAVHRLDRDTSGVIVFAKNRDSHRMLSIAFEERDVSKKYIALVTGSPREDTGVIDLAIEENISHKGSMKISKKGKQCLTEYKVTERFRDYSLVEVTLHTGRTHQIRVHFQAIGHPLAVDPIYGGAADIRLSKIKRRYNFPEWENERPLLSRVSLHSWKLTLSHPVTGAAMEFVSPLPKDIRATVDQLRKNAPALH